MFKFLKVNKLTMSFGFLGQTNNCPSEGRLKDLYLVCTKS